MTGDVLLHEGLWASAETDARRTGRGTMDYRPILADMRPVISSADLAICHLETPLAPKGGPYSGYPVFSVPPQILPALKWEGYDACTTVSNHSLDDGFSGIQRTLADFDRIGLAHFGTATTKHAARTPLIMDVAGVKVGLIAATYGTNGIPIPSAEPWSVPIINTAHIERMAAKAKRMGADIVMVALHWGLEYDHAPIQDQLDVARCAHEGPRHQPDLRPSRPCRPALRQGQRHLGRLRPRQRDRAAGHCRRGRLRRQYLPGDLHGAAGRVVPGLQARVPADDDHPLRRRPPHALARRAEGSARPGVRLAAAGVCGPPRSGCRRMSTCSAPSSTASPRCASRN